MVLEDPFVWPPMERRESSQRQTRKLSLTLSESTTRDVLRLASRTPQAALRPTESWPETLVLYRRRAFRAASACARCSSAPSIKPFERSRPWLRRTRALCKFN